MDTEGGRMEGKEGEEIRKGIEGGRDKGKRPE
jgi:hypothetical protein